MSHLISYLSEEVGHPTDKMWHKTNKHLCDANGNSMEMRVKVYKWGEFIEACYFFFKLNKRVCYHK